MRTLKTYVSCYIFVGILIYVVSACVRFKVKQSNNTQRSLYERVKRGMGLGGEGGKRLEEREGIPQIMSQYWEWGKAGIISMGDVVRCIFFCKSKISY